MKRQFEGELTREFGLFGVIARIFFLFFGGNFKWTAQVVRHSFIVMVILMMMTRSVFSKLLDGHGSCSRVDKILTSY